LRKRPIGAHARLQRYFQTSERFYIVFRKRSQSLLQLVAGTRGPTE
jgi:hypothetical protein